ncbi:MAG: histidine--tRNA ligase [Candidatus Omnitrophota bacterium]
MRGIVPRKIKGFRDLEPELNRVRWDIINAATNVYRLYGFEHWDTPLMEYADCLGKYLPDTDSVAEGVYSFQNPEKEPILQSDGKELRDESDRVIMDHHFITLRYDLTAPLARVYAERLWAQYLRGQVQENKTALFRRYQYGPVFRFEHKLDPGRFREFWQIDFDTVGTDDVSVDAEACMILSDAMEALGLKRGDYTVKVNNRKLLKGFLSHLGIATEEREQDVLRVIDKVDKIGIRCMAEELGDGRLDQSGAKIPGLGLEKPMITPIVDFLETFSGLQKRADVLENLAHTGELNAMSAQGIAELRQIDAALAGVGFDEDRVVFSPTLVRGMAYYTGPIFEVESNRTFMDEKGRERRVGSICGGGRYDNLVKNLLGIKVPATGASIGVDRLAELLVLTHRIPERLNVPGPVLIIAFDNRLMPEYQNMARDLRNQGINTEIYYGFQRGLKKQLAYADQKNCPVAVLMGEDECQKGVVTIRDLRMGKQMASEISDKEEWKTKVQFEVSRETLTRKISGMLEP